MIMGMFTFILIFVIVPALLWAWFLTIDSLTTRLLDARAARIRV